MKTNLKEAKKSTIRQAIRVGRSALATLTRSGWCQGRSESWDGRVCATQAINVASGIHHNFAAEKLFRDACSDVLRSRKQVTHIVRFNDDVAKSSRAVKRLFKRALGRLILAEMR